MADPTTGSLGNLSSGLGNIALGYGGSNLVIATWLKSRVDDSPDNMIFSMGDGFKFTLQKNVPTIMTSAQVAVARAEGAVLAIVGSA